MSTRLLFLDIDGVMHSIDRVQAIHTNARTEYTGDRLFEHLPLLGRILDQCPDVSVIISSAWRDVYTLSELQKFFGSWGHRVIGTTLSIDALDSIPRNRFRECQRVAERLGVSDWLVLDDQPGIVWGSQIPKPELARRVFWCDPVLGLATPLVVTGIVRRFLDGETR